MVAIQPDAVIEARAGSTTTLSSSTFFDSYNQAQNNFNQASQAISIGAIVGIVIAGVVAISFIVFLFVAFSRYTKRRNLATTVAPSGGNMQFAYGPGPGLVAQHAVPQSYAPKELASSYRLSDSSTVDRAEATGDARWRSELQSGSHVPEFPNSAQRSELPAVPHTAHV